MAVVSISFRLRICPRPESWETRTGAMLDLMSRRLRPAFLSLRVWRLSRAGFSTFLRSVAAVNGLNASAEIRLHSFAEAQQAMQGIKFAAIGRPLASNAAPLSDAGARANYR